MTPKHHLDIATLMTCAAGSQPEVLAAVISSHLSVCPQCRTELRGLTRVGAVLFDGLAPVEMTAHLLNVAHAAVSHKSRTSRPADTAVPPVLTSVGENFDHLDWKDAGAGVRSAALPLSPGAHGRLCVVHLDPGARLPDAVHRSRDLTFVMSGSYLSGENEFAAGDIDDADAPSEQPPVADAQNGCVCLIASERGITV